MKTEHKFAEALKNMMSDTPLDSISVAALCKKCKVNRQTFYYHFHNIYDLLTLVYLDEKIVGLDKVKTIKELMKVIYDYSLKNSSFITATLNSAGKDLFEEFVYNAIYRTMYKLLSEATDGKKLHANDRKSIARFYALGYSHSFLYYFSTHKNKNFDAMMSIFSFLGDNLLYEAILNFIYNKGKEK